MFDLELLLLPLRQQFPDVTDEDVHQLLSICSPIYYKKGDVVLNAGSSKQLIVLVLDGIFRTYLNHEDGEESTLSLHRPIEFFGTWESVYLNQPTTRALGAATNGSALLIDYPTMKKLIAHNPRLQHAYYEVSIHMNAKWLMFYQDMISQRTPEQRYLFVHNWLGEYQSSISQRVLASFLGLNPVSLSRIKKRVLSEPAR